MKKKSLKLSKNSNFSRKLCHCYSYSGGLFESIDMTMIEAKKIAFFMKKSMLKQ